MSAGRGSAAVVATAVAMAAALACSGSSPPACDLDPAIDAEGCAALHAMALQAALPPSRGNAHADDENAATLGFEIFFDARFSSNTQVRCATCHVPESYFADGKPTSVGMQTVARNSPTLLDAARMATFFWDGRADSLWSQPLFALENPAEMDFTRLEVAHLVARLHLAEYEALFGPMPPLDDATRFPARGKPGDAAWEAMAQADQDAVNRVAANVGKALEAYVRKLAAGPAAFDRFLGGDRAALGDAERRGMVAFVKARCHDCHSGPMLSDMAFHDLGVPAPAGQPPDRGRADGVATLRADPFNGAGPYVDGPAYPPPDATPADLGAFRTPSLRNVTLSAPYMHDGAYATLDDAIAFHLAGGGRGQGGFVGDVDPRLVPRVLSDDEKKDLVAFLGALKGAYPLPPWNDWPH